MRFLLEINGSWRVSCKDAEARKVMPNDAKVGLVLGLGLVIVVAVIYFRSDASRMREETPTAAAAKPSSTPRQRPPRGQSRATKARPAVQTEQSEPTDSPAKIEDETANPKP
jgi:hypothetical protein